MWYSIDSRKTKIGFKNGPKVVVLLDTSAKINVMTREVIENAGLAMRNSPKLELVSHTGHSCFFLCFCEDIEVIIRGLKTRHLILIVEHGDHDLVLD